MARKQKTEANVAEQPVAEQPAAEQPEGEQDELVKAQAEIADYGDDESIDSLVKAVQSETATLAKGGKMQPPANDDDEEESDDDESEGEDDEEDDEEESDDESEGDDDGDADDMSDQAPAPPAKKKAPAPMKRSRASDAGERFLKSVLLDEEGQPTAEAEVIEVSDVLVHMTDTMAKSIGELAETIGAMQLQLDQVITLQKAMGHHQIQTGKIVKSMQSAADRKPATAPHPGVTHSIKKSMPGQPPQAEHALTKSQAAAGLLAAFQLGEIGTDQYRRLAPMLDTQGVEAVMGQLSDVLRQKISDAAISLNGNGTK